MYHTHALPPPPTQLLSQTRQQQVIRLFYIVPI